MEPQAQPDLLPATPGLLDPSPSCPLPTGADPDCRTRVQGRQHLLPLHGAHACSGLRGSSARLQVPGRLSPPKRGTCRPRERVTD